MRFGRWDHKVVLYQSIHIITHPWKGSQAENNPLSLRNPARIGDNQPINLRKGAGMIVAITMSTFRRRKSD
jgi:hypothetical protein